MTWKSKNSNKKNGNWKFSFLSRLKFQNNNEILRNMNFSLLFNLLIFDFFREIFTFPGLVWAHKKFSHLLQSNFHVCIREKKKGIFCMYCHIFRISLFMRNLLSDIVETAKFENASRIFFSSEVECLSYFVRNTSSYGSDWEGGEKSRVDYLLLWQVSE